MYFMYIMYMLCFCTLCSYATCEWPEFYVNKDMCYDIKPVRKEEGKSYWKIPLCDDDATREK